MAKEVAQIMQSWLPAPTAPDPSSQQRILDLEAQLAITLKGQQSSDAPTTGSAPTGSTTTAPIVQALHGQQPSAPTFSPQSLLTMLGSPHPWFEANPIPSLTDTAYKILQEVAQGSSAASTQKGCLGEESCQGPGMVEQTAGRFE